MVERLRPSLAEWKDDTMTRKEQRSSCWDGLARGSRGEGSAAWLTARRLALKHCGRAGLWAERCWFTSWSLSKRNRFHSVYIPADPPVISCDFTICSFMTLFNRNQTHKHCMNSVWTLRFVVHGSNQMFHLWSKNCQILDHFEVNLVTLGTCFVHKLNNKHFEWSLTGFFSIATAAEAHGYCSISSQVMVSSCRSFCGSVCSDRKQLCVKKVLPTPEK